jgi:hypothetical protein
VKTRLTNVVDEELVHRGLLARDAVRTYEADALVDTGAVRTVVPPDALVLGDEILIGQTVLEKLDRFVDCQRRRVVPNPAHPDHAVTKVK